MKIPVDHKKEKVPSGPDSCSVRFDGDASVTPPLMLHSSSSPTSTDVASTVDHTRSQFTSSKQSSHKTLIGKDWGTRKQNSCVKYIHINRHKWSFLHLGVSDATKLGESCRNTPKPFPNMNRSYQFPWSHQSQKHFYTLMISKTPRRYRPNSMMVIVSGTPVKSNPPTPRAEQCNIHNEVISKANSDLAPAPCSDSGVSHCLPYTDSQIWSDNNFWIKFWSRLMV